MDEFSSSSRFNEGEGLLSSDDSSVVDYSRTSDVENRKRYFTSTRMIFVISSLFLLAVMLLFVFATTFITFRGYSSEKTETVSLFGEENTGDIHLHKYLAVERSTGESSTFVSMKEINEFSLYPAERGVDVFAFDANHGENSFGERTKEFTCSCDLGEVLEIFEGIDFDRRSSMSSTTTEIIAQNEERRSALVSRGLILAGVMGSLIVMYKSREITLRIFANSEEEAVGFAADEMTSRVISEIETTRSSPVAVFRHNTYDEEDDQYEAEYDGGNDELRWRLDEMEGRVEDLEGRIESLEEELMKVRDIMEKQTKCEQAKQDVKEVVPIICGAGSKIDEEDGDVLYCGVFEKWIGNDFFFHTLNHEELAKSSIKNHFKKIGKKYLGSSFHCFDDDSMDVRFFTHNQVYMTPSGRKLNEPDVVNFFDDFRNYCLKNSADSCYSWIQE